MGEPSRAVKHLRAGRTVGTPPWVVGGPTGIRTLDQAVMSRQL